MGPDLGTSTISSRTQDKGGNVTHEIVPDSACKQDSVLGYDCQSRAKILKTNGSDINAIDSNFSGVGINESEERESKS